MVRVLATDVFDHWFDSLRDENAKARIVVRIDRLKDGNPGDMKSVGDGVSEMRIAYGPGYRLYCAWRGAVLVILLCGGDKGSQRRDIAKAKVLLSKIGDEEW